jgi:dTDP-3-amino-3,4,6-trideoxy-alpha-D-glucose transaminase
VAETEPVILQNDFKRQWKTIGEKVAAALERVGSSGRYILGEEVAAFEKALAEFWGVAHAIGTGNGLDALEIGLRCLNLRPGEKVLTTPFSAFATTLAILRAGGLPVFVDIDQTGGIDLRRCRQLLARDQSIRFFVPVHLYGNPLALAELRALQREFGLRVVEDCAQAIGASAQGIRAGTVGQVAAASFYPTKNLGALGDAGALLTNDPAIAAAATELRNYGQSAQYVHSRLGLNSRLDELHAAILRDALLPKLGGWTMARRAIARRYRNEIRNPALEHLAVMPEAEPVWHIFPILVEPGSRETFQKHLASLGIVTGIHYPRIIPKQAALTDSRFEIDAGLDHALRFSGSEVSLPVHPFMTEEEVVTVIEACNHWPG